MARAYASGETPQFVSVAPDGDNEMWKLADVLFVVPVVPPGAPPELEYALRLRRDASLSGKCESCGAAFDIEWSEAAGKGSVGAGLFPHRGNCLAADENIMPLMIAHFKAREKSTLKEILEAASRDTKAKLESSMSDQLKLPSTERNHERITKLLDGKTANSQRCGHLTSMPAQTWNIFLWDDTWRCDECFARFGHVGRTRGIPLLSPLEESTCDYCRRYSPTFLHPIVARMGLFMLFGAGCRRCASEFKFGSGKMGEGNREASS